MTNKSPLPNELIIANCNACLLADRMKDCPLCSFNPGSLTLTPAQKLQVHRQGLLKPVLKPVKTLS